MTRGDLGERVRIVLAYRALEVPGLVAELLEAGFGGQVGHDGSFRAPAVRVASRKEVCLLHVGGPACRAGHRWTLSFPRTGGALRTWHHGNAPGPEHARPRRPGRPASPPGLAARGAPPRRDR